MLLPYHFHMGDDADTNTDNDDADTNTDNVNRLLQVVLFDSFTSIDIGTDHVHTAIRGFNQNIRLTRGAQC